MSGKSLNVHQMKIHKNRGIEVVRKSKYMGNK